MLSFSKGSSTEHARGLSHIGLGIGLSAAVYSLSGFHFRSLFSYFFLRAPSSDGWKLDFAPSDIDWADRMFLLVFGVLNKAVRGIFSSSLKVRGKETVQLPRLDIRCPAHVSGEHQTLYSGALTLDSEAMEAEKINQGGLAESFLLAALTNQLMLLLVVHPRLPVSPLGAVNVRNRIEFHQHPLRHNQKLRAHAYVGGSKDLGRVVRRGVEFDVYIDITDSSSSQLVLRQTLTILSPCKTFATAAKSQDSSSEVKYETIGEIYMPASAPSWWSSLCGDYNPIHVSSILAKLFGFPGKIAHGNHVVAKFLRLVSSQGSLAEIAQGKGWWIEMDFKRPMVLPIRLAAEVDSGQSQVPWRCVRDDKPYVLGSIGQL